MGRELAEAFPEAKLVFQEVDEALKQNLFKIMVEGPDDALTLTENAQPALMAVSLAVVRVLEHAGLRLPSHSAYVAGHSLGEYSALAAAGALSLADTARLLKIRGQAMQKAVPVGVGAMAALLGLDIEQAGDVATKAARPGEVCEAANDNAPGQVVVSGHAVAVERALALASEAGAKRAILLPVSAPFHCALMQPAAEVMAEALSRVTFNVPALPVVTNVTAAAESNPVRLAELLVAQVTGSVRWRESVLWMKAQGVDSLVELGSGKVLSGLAKRIDKDVAGRSLNTPADIEAFLKEIL